MLKSLCKKLNRTKKLDPDQMLITPLNRCLSTFDITLLGVGHTAGAGIYVLTGEVAKNVAGPGVILSYITAGFAAFLTAICYAEFGARVPHAGSAYSYTYVTIGEFWAFLVGWNIVLEHMVGIASVATAWSGSVDSLFNGAVTNGTMRYVGEMNVDFFSCTPDFLACLVCLIMGMLLITKVKGSSYINIFLSTINLGVIVFAICCGMYWANGKNWTQVSGGILPFGLSGVLKGAGLCFYSYVGMDVIAVSGEEAHNPQRSIPIATLGAMSIVTFLYAMMSTILTLMVPYDSINTAAAFPTAFDANGATWAKYIVAAGSLSGMTCTLYGLLFALPRCLYAMASDGLFFAIFCKINQKLQVPLFGILTCTVCTCLIALLFEFDKLVELLAIGTLLAYTFVNVSILILRYQPYAKYTSYISSPADTFGNSEEISKDTDTAGQLKPYFQFLKPFLKFEPGFVARSCVIFMTVFMAASCCLIKLAIDELLNAVWWAILLLVFFLVAALVCLLFTCCFQQSTQPLAFKVPCVPLIPAVSVFLNLLLMSNLNQMTWIRFAVWGLIGLLVYFGYSMRHSKEDDSALTRSALLLPAKESIELSNPDFRNY